MDKKQEYCPPQVEEMVLSTENALLTASGEDIVWDS